VCKQFPEDFNAQQKKKLIHDAKFYYWDEKGTWGRERAGSAVGAREAPAWPITVA